jgi:hypothetical protein
MKTSLEKYKADLAALIRRGGVLHNAIQLECHPKEFRALANEQLGEQAEDLLKQIPSFRGTYQEWYSEALNLVRQLLPNRLNDFTRLYEKPKSRKSIEYGNYVIEDYLQSLSVKLHGEEKVGPSAAIPQFEQQLNIVKSIQQRFESSLFDVQRLVQADLFDSELAAARELLRNKFHRAAGAMAGVVLERHLQQVCDDHGVKLAKKEPTIGDLNDALKANSSIDTSQWRFVQHLADLRNLCDHNKKQEPTEDQVTDLIVGVEKVMKTLF